MAKVSITFFPYIRKKTPGGKIPIYFRIGLKKKKAEYRLNAEVEMKDLEFWNELIMRFDIPNFQVNDTLDDISITFKKFISLHETELHEYDAKKIMYTLFKKSDQIDHSPLWKDYYENFYITSVLHKTAMDAGTKINYQKAINHMNHFLKLVGKENIKIKEINMKFAKDFAEYLLNEKTIYVEGLSKSLLRPGMSEPSALGQVKKFRTILECAIDEDLLTRNYFKKVKLSNVSPEGENLTPFQVKLFWNCNKLLSPELIIYRDIFLWSVFTGMSYADAANLKKEKITKQSETEFRLTSRRGKTNELYDQFLCIPAIQIMEKYKDHPEIEILGSVIPKRSNTQLNKNLKIIGKKLNLPIKLKTHVARRSFRQLVGEAGIVTDSVIKKLMGHSNGKNIDSRYYKVNEKPLLEAKKCFDSFIINELKIISWN